jgi:hypothetical protein
MGKRIYPSNVLDQAQTVVAAWTQIGATVTLGTLLPAALTTDITAATTLDAQIASLELQLTNARNQRDVLYYGLWDKVKRVRAGVRANYGDDSSQYELVGGTRLSDRKSPVRKILASAN